MIILHYFFTKIRKNHRIKFFYNGHNFYLNCILKRKQKSALDQNSYIPFLRNEIRGHFYDDKNNRDESYL